MENSYVKFDIHNYLSIVKDNEPHHEFKRKHKKVLEKDDLTIRVRLIEYYGTRVYTAYNDQNILFKLNFVNGKFIGELGKVYTFLVKPLDIRTDVFQNALDINDESQPLVYFVEVEVIGVYKHDPTQEF